MLANCNETLDDGDIELSGIDEHLVDEWTQPVRADAERGFHEPQSSAPFLGGLGATHPIVMREVYEHQVRWYLIVFSQKL